MPRMTNRSRKPTAFSKAHDEFWKMPSKNLPATTTTPSIRNAVYNVKSLPGGFVKVAKDVAKSFSSLNEYHSKRGRRR